MAYKQIGIVYHPLNERAHKLAEILYERLIQSNQYNGWICSAWEASELKEKAKTVEFIVTTGGDGTILRVVQALEGRTVPITGINFGRVGFLTELSPDETDLLPELFAGQAGWIDERALLRCEHYPVADPQNSHVFYALNDAVIARGRIARIIRLQIRLNDEYFTTYKADGVISSTATGSTAYNIAAGGPVLEPSSKHFIVNPISAHMSPEYPLVLSPEKYVDFVVDTHHEAVLCVDGHIHIVLTSGDRIRVTVDENRVANFLRYHRKGSFYSTLEQRLKGNEFFK